jgi:hypothetical protein
MLHTLAARAATLRLRSIFSSIREPEAGLPPLAKGAAAPINVVFFRKLLRDSYLSLIRYLSKLRTEERLEGVGRTIPHPALSPATHQHTIQMSIEFLIAPASTVSIWKGFAARCPVRWTDLTRAEGTVHSFRSR